VCTVAHVIDGRRWHHITALNDGDIEGKQFFNNDDDVVEDGGGGDGCCT
jgi:hypothetical protein